MDRRFDKDYSFRNNAGDRKGSWKSAPGSIRAPGGVERLRGNATLRQAQVPDSVYQQLKAERDELDEECSHLHEKNGDLNLELQNLQEELQQTREEVQTLKQTLAERQAVDRTVETEQEVHSLQPQAKKLTGSGELPNLDEIRSRILGETRSDKLKAVTKALDDFITGLKTVNS